MFSRRGSVKAQSWWKYLLASQPLLGYVISSSSSSSSSCTDSTDLACLSIIHYNTSLMVDPPNYIQCPHRADRPTQALTCTGVPRRTSLLCSPLFLKLGSTCFDLRTWMVCETMGRWSYNCCFVGYCFQDLFKTAHNILVLFSSSLFTRRCVKVHMIRPSNSTDMTKTPKNTRFFFTRKTRFPYDR